MNALYELMRQPLAHRVGWVLLHSLWQGALVGAAFGLLRQGLRRRSAEVRYAAGCLALALLLAGPIITLGLWPAPVPGASPVAGGAALTGGWGTVSAARSAADSAVGNGVYSLVQWATDFCGRLAPLLAAAWLLGVSVCLARLAQGCWWVKRIRCQFLAPVEPGWLEVLDDLRCRLEISRPVRLLKSAVVEVPTVLGWIRPVILLPAATLAGLAPEQLEAILAHELAHVRRWDYVVNACQCALETVMFYHPVVWWVSRCVREERENCCDDLVVRVCGNRVAYARALATLEESRAELPDLAFAASGAPLLKRIRRLLGLAGDHGAATARQLGGLGLLSVGLPLILVGVYLMFATASYRAVARILLSQAAPSQPGPAGAKTDSPIYDPYLILTQFEIIQSESILGQVVERLNLRERWGKKYANGEKLSLVEAVAVLKGRLALRPVRNTTLIEIQAFGEKADEAAELANAVAETYRDWRLEEHQKLTAGGIEALLAERRAKDGELAQGRTNVDRLRKELNLPDSTMTGNSPAPLITAETLRRMNELRLDAEAEFVRQGTLLKHLRTLSREQLTQALPTAAQDNLLSSILEQRILVEQKLVLLRHDFGAQHLEVVKAESQLADLQEKINQRVDGMMLGLSAKVEALGESLTNLLQKVAATTQGDIDKANRSQAYFEQKHRLEELERFRTLLDTKIASENIELALPRTAQVEIVDRAHGPRHPASPNRSLAAGLIASGLLLDLLGILMVKGGRRPEPESQPPSEVRNQPGGRVSNL